MIVACVWTGHKYGIEYVERLSRMVARHMPVDYRFVCLTDNAASLTGIGEAFDISTYGLPGWWGKMALFQPGWRMSEDVLYFDLDTVIIGSLFPLAALTAEFAICANFTRAAGNTTWPCRYGSCVMKIGATVDGRVFQTFMKDKEASMLRYRSTGDQRLIEDLIPDAMLLQEMLPAGFFLGYRDLHHHVAKPPLGCSVVVFAGKNKPDNCQVPWARAAWEA